MPVINIVVNEIDHHRLGQEHAALVAAWSRLGNKTQAPTFAQWLGTRTVGEPGTTPDSQALGDIRVFNAIERLITILPQHGFSLAHTAPGNSEPATGASALGEAIVSDFQLQPQYAKRLQELFTHYLKNAREIADAAHIGITNRAYGALTEAHRQFLARTSAAMATLGAEKAIGRIEGATAILVSLDVMDRNTARKRTTAFKAEAQAVRKPGLLKRMFKDK